MAKALKEIFAALAALEGGAALIADLQENFTEVRGEAAKYRTSRNEVLAALGITEGADVTAAINGIKSTLDTIKSSGGKPDELGSQIATLSAQIKTLTEKSEASEKLAAEEKSKRINATKVSNAMAALQAGNAANPEIISKLILDKLVAKDDDKLVFAADDGKELSVEDGVKNFLAANPWAVKNVQSPGGGSGAGGDPGVKIYSRAEIEAMTPEQINADWKNVQESMKKI